MRRIHSLIFGLILFVGCVTTQPICPSSLDAKVDFNMPLGDFNKLKKTSTNDMNDGGFRWTYLEEVEDDKLSHIAYYFDKDGIEPLYEMIFIYKDSLTMASEAERLLGPPNKGEEWRLERKPHDVLAWKFKSKLIMTALIPKTEWWEEEN